MYDQLLLERDEIEAAAAAHAEDQENRLRTVSEAATAVECEKAQLLQHLHVSQQENLQLHGQQQLDEREKKTMSAVTSQLEGAQQAAAAQLRALQVPILRQKLLLSAVNLSCRQKLLLYGPRTRSCCS
jgi:hypothetical protein